jgi:hypothetical protein
MPLMQVLDEIGVDVASQVNYSSAFSFYYTCKQLILNADFDVFNIIQLSSAPKGRIGASNKKAENNQARYTISSSPTIVVKMSM